MSCCFNERLPLSQNLHLEIGCLLINRKKIRKLYGRIVELRQFGLPMTTETIRGIIGEVRFCCQKLFHSFMMTLSEDLLCSDGLLERKDGNITPDCTVTSSNGS